MAGLIRRASEWKRSRAATREQNDDSGKPGWKHGAGKVFSAAALAAAAKAGDLMHMKKGNKTASAEVRQMAFVQTLWRDHIGATSLQLLPPVLLAWGQGSEAQLDALTWTSMHPVTHAQLHLHPWLLRLDHASPFFPATAQLLCALISFQASRAHRKGDAHKPSASFGDPKTLILEELKECFADQLGTTLHRQGATSLQTIKTRISYVSHLRTSGVFGSKSFNVLLLEIEDTLETLLPNLKLRVIHSNVLDIHGGLEKTCWRLLDNLLQFLFHVYRKEMANDYDPDVAELPLGIASLQRGVRRTLGLKPLLQTVSALCLQHLVTHPSIVQALEGSAAHSATHTAQPKGATHANDSHSAATSALNPFLVLEGPRLAPRGVVPSLLLPGTNANYQTGLLKLASSLSAVDVVLRLHGYALELGRLMLLARAVHTSAQSSGACITDAKAKYHTRNLMRVLSGLLSAISASTSKAFKTSGKTQREQTVMVSMEVDGQGGEEAEEDAVEEEEESIAGILEREIVQACVTATSQAGTLARQAREQLATGAGQPALPPVLLRFLDACPAIVEACNRRLPKEVRVEVETFQANASAPRFRTQPVVPARSRYRANDDDTTAKDLARLASKYQTAPVGRRGRLRKSMDMDARRRTRRGDEGDEEEDETHTTAVHEGVTSEGDQDEGRPLTRMESLLVGRGAGARTSQAYLYLQQGHRHLRNGNPHLASENYTKAIELCPRDASIAHALSLAAKVKSKSQTTLNKVKTELSDGGLALICRQLRATLDCPITSVQLDHNDLTYRGMRYLAAGLKHAQLSNLSLGFNSIGDRGIRYVVRVLSACPLTSLSLVSTGLTARGACQLASHLRTGTSLVTLDLSSNPIGDLGVQAIAMARGMNATSALNTLTLLDTGVGEVGGKALVQLLQKAHDRWRAQQAQRQRQETTSYRAVQAQPSGGSAPPVALLSPDARLSATTRNKLDTLNEANRQAQGTGVPPRRPSVWASLPAVLEAQTQHAQRQEPASLTFPFSAAQLAQLGLVQSRFVTHVQNEPQLETDALPQVLGVSHPSLLPHLKPTPTEASSARVLTSIRGDKASSEFQQAVRHAALVLTAYQRARSDEVASWLQPDDGFLLNDPINLFVQEVKEWLKWIASTTCSKTTLGLVEDRLTYLQSILQLCEEADKKQADGDLGAGLMSSPNTLAMLKDLVKAVDNIRLRGVADLTARKDAHRIRILRDQGTRLLSHATLFALLCPRNQTRTSPDSVLAKQINNLRSARIQDMQLRNAMQTSIGQAFQLLLAAPAFAALFPHKQDALDGWLLPRGVLGQPFYNPFFDTATGAPVLPASVTPPPLTAMAENQDTAVERAKAAVCRGYLYKTGGRELSSGFKLRFVLLQDHSLFYFGKESDVKPKGQIPLTLDTTVKALEDDNARANTFYLSSTTLGRKYFFACEDPEEREDWIGAITRLIATAPATRHAPREGDEGLCGMLAKTGAHGLSKGFLNRYFRLAGQELQYFKHHNDRKPKGRILLSSGSVVKAEPDCGRSYAFSIQRRGGRAYYLAAVDDQDRQTWIDAIGEQIRSSVPVAAVAGAELSQPLTGYLRKTGSGGPKKGFSKRWFALEKTSLTYHKKEGMKAKGVIELCHDTTLDKEDSQPNCFIISSPSQDKGRKYWLAAETEGDYMNWVSAINARLRLLQGGSAYRLSSRHLSMGDGNRDDDDDNDDDDDEDNDDDDDDDASESSTHATSSNPFDSVSSATSNPFGESEGNPFGPASPAPGNPFGTSAEPPPDTDVSATSGNPFGTAAEPPLGTDAFDTSGNPFGTPVEPLSSTNPFDTQDTAECIPVDSQVTVEDQLLFVGPERVTGLLACFKNNDQAALEVLSLHGLLLLLAQALVLLRTLDRPQRTPLHGTPLSRLLRNVLQVSTQLADAVSLKCKDIFQIYTDAGMGSAATEGSDGVAVTLLRKLERDADDFSVSLSAWTSSLASLSSRGTTQGEGRGEQDEQTRVWSHAASTFMAACAVCVDGVQSSESSETEDRLVEADGDGDHSESEVVRMLEHERIEAEEQRLALQQLGEAHSVEEAAVSVAAAGATDDVSTLTVVQAAGAGSNPFAPPAASSNPFENDTLPTAPPEGPTVASPHSMESSSVAATNPFAQTDDDNDSVAHPDGDEEQGTTNPFAEHEDGEEGVQHDLDDVPPQPSLPDMHGWMQKAGAEGLGKGKRGFKKRWFALKGFSLSYFKKEKDAKAAGEVLLQPGQSLCYLVHDSPVPFTFALAPLPEGRTYYFAAPSDAMRDDWVGHILRRANQAPVLAPIQGSTNKQRNVRAKLGGLKVKANAQVHRAAKQAKEKALQAKVAAVHKAKEATKAAAAKTKHIAKTGVGRLSCSSQTLPQVTGWLKKTGAGGLPKGFRLRWFVLSDSVLQYFKDERALRPAGQIVLTRTASIVETELWTLLSESSSDSHVNPFTLCLRSSSSSSSRAYYLACADTRQRDQWLLAITERVKLMADTTDDPREGEEHTDHDEVEEDDEGGGGGGNTLEGWSSGDEDADLQYILEYQDKKRTREEGEEEPQGGEDALAVLRRRRDLVDGYEAKAERFITQEQPDQAIRWLVAGLELLPSRTSLALGIARAAKLGVTQLLLANSQISDGDIGRIALRVEDNQLERLDLSNNLLTSNGVSQLANSLARCPSLMHLVLSGNRGIGGGGGGGDKALDGARAIALLLLKQPNLQTLEYASCGMSTSGAYFIAAALKQNQVLTTLDLSGNPLTDDVIAALASALTQNTKSRMAELRLDITLIAQRGAFSLRRLLNSSISLQHLVLAVGDTATDNGTDDRETSTDIMMTLTRALSQRRAQVAMAVGTGTAAEQWNSVETRARAMLDLDLEAYLQRLQSVISSQQPDAVEVLVVSLVLPHHVTQLLQLLDTDDTKIEVVRDGLCRLGQIVSGVADVIKDQSPAALAALQDRLDDWDAVLWEATQALLTRVWENMGSEGLSEFLELCQEDPEVIVATTRFLGIFELEHDVVDVPVGGSGAVHIAALVKLLQARQWNVCMEMPGKSIQDIVQEKWRAAVKSVFASFTQSNEEVDAADDGHRKSIAVSAAFLSDMGDLGFAVADQVPSVDATAVTAEQIVDGLDAAKDEVENLQLLEQYAKPLFPPHWNLLTMVLPEVHEQCKGLVEQAAGMGTMPLVVSSLNWLRWYDVELQELLLGPVDAEQNARPDGTNDDPVPEQTSDSEEEEKGESRAQEDDAGQGDGERDEEGEGGQYLRREHMYSADILRLTEKLSDMFFTAMERKVRGWVRSLLVQERKAETTKDQNGRYSTPGPGDLFQALHRFVTFASRSIPFSDQEWERLAGIVCTLISSFSQQHAAFFANAQFDSDPDNMCEEAQRNPTEYSLLHDGQARFTVDIVRSSDFVLANANNEEELVRHLEQLREECCRHLQGSDAVGRVQDMFDECEDSFSDIKVQCAELLVRLMFQSNLSAKLKQTRLIAGEALDELLDVMSETLRMVSESVASEAFLGYMTKRCLSSLMNECAHVYVQQLQTLVPRHTKDHKEDDQWVIFPLSQENVQLVASVSEFFEQFSDLNLSQATQSDLGTLSVINGLLNADPALMSAHFKSVCLRFSGLGGTLEPRKLLSTLLALRRDVSKRRRGDILADFDKLAGA